MSRTRSLAFMVLLVGLMMLPALVNAADEGPAPAMQRAHLADLRLAADDVSRKDLKYLVSCALGPQTLLEADVDGQHHEFPGGAGLAPAWQQRALTAEEERWVSACILARTNYYGATVKISLRSPFPTSAPGLQIESDELERFPVEDATFFGNIFGRVPLAYVCGRNDTAERKLRLMAYKRICGLPLDQTLPDGRRITACRFIYVGACTPANFSQDGVEYTEAVTIHLKPTPD